MSQNDGSNLEMLDSERLLTYRESEIRTLRLPIVHLGYWAVHQIEAPNYPDHLVLLCLETVGQTYMYALSEVQMRHRRDESGLGYRTDAIAFRGDPRKFVKIARLILRHFGED